MVSRAYYRNDKVHTDGALNLFALGYGAFYLTGIRDSSGELNNVEDAPVVGLSSRNADTMMVNEDAAVQRQRHDGLLSVRSGR
jgi:hypothetical protein